MLAELHLHLYGCIRGRDLLDHIVDSNQTVLWDWYEREFEAAYGTSADTRAIVARYRAGDESAAADFEDRFIFGDRDAGNFARFQAKFNLLIAGSTLADLEATPDRVRLETAAFAASIRADHLSQGVTYSEQRFRFGTDLTGEREQAVLDALLRSFASSSDTITERLAISLPRDDPFRGWEMTKQLALSEFGETLTAVDFCHVEERFPPKDVAPLFDAVHDFNRQHPDRALAILYHVGESFTDKSLESAVRWVQESAELGAHRLGHAIALGFDPASIGPHERTEAVSERLDQIAYDVANAVELQHAGVPIDRDQLDAERAALRDRAADAELTIVYDDDRLELVRRRQEAAMRVVRATGAVIEVCPTSNMRIGDIADPAHHPVHRFLEADLPVVVCSDDPGIFGTTLAAELDWVCEHTGGGDELRQQLIERSWNSRSEVLTGRIPVTG